MAVLDIKKMVPERTKLKKSLGLDIGSFAVKAVELSSSSDKINVSAFGTVCVANLPRQETANSIRRLLSQSGITLREAVISVSGPSVIERFITLPKMDEEALKGAIKFEAEKLIPFDINDCIIDHKILGKDDRENKINVLLVAVKKDHLSSKLKLAEEAGLAVRLVDVDMFAAANALMKCFKNPADKTVAILNMGASLTNVSILRGEGAYFARDIAIGGNDFSLAISKMTGLAAGAAEELKLSPNEKIKDLIGFFKPVLNNLLDEVKLSFSYYENQTGKGIDAIYVSGGGSGIVGLADAFQENFGSSPSILNPMHFAEIGLVGSGKGSLEKTGSSFTVAIGLALR
ncbi:MAG: type IV pilus assembly protein PilM [Candidatus Omnitrophica bacterium]|nr:type IV pilus assembly protein PilM [Candidatus Omnitrophota bacterium]